MTPISKPFSRTAGRLPFGVAAAAIVAIVAAVALAAVLLVTLLRPASVVETGRHTLITGDPASVSLPLYSDYLRDISVGWGTPTGGSGGDGARGPIYSEYLQEISAGW